MIECPGEIHTPTPTHTDVTNSQRLIILLQLSRLTDGASLAQPGHGRHHVTRGDPAHTRVESAFNKLEGTGDIT